MVMDLMWRIGYDLIKQREKNHASHILTALKDVDNLKMCSQAALSSDSNMVVSAPTKSGKTGIMEMAIVRLLSEKVSENAKVVYVAPSKALCHERASDWKTKFSKLNISCNELTGDSAFGTINKAQGQSLNRVGVHLAESVFGHGQLYVAISRATSRSRLKFFLGQDATTNTVINVV
jgi:hypothetical protein